MFGHKGGPSRNWVYGCLAPIEGLEHFEQQVSLMHKYRNKLVEIEHQRRADYHAILRRLCPEVLALEEELAPVLEAQERERDRLARLRQERGVKKLPAAETACARSLTKEVRERRTRLKQCKKESKGPEIEAALKEGREKNQQARKQAEHESGLYWGNYLTIEQAALSFGKGAPPQFHAWHKVHEHKIAVQLQNGLSVDKFMQGRDTRLRCHLMRTTANGRRILGQVSLRVGSAGKGGRQPIWCIVPVVWHRPLPEDAMIKWAYLRRKTWGTRQDWELQLVLERKKDWPRQQAPDGVVTIDVGWRLKEDGALKVATWKDTEGKEGELILPTVMMWRWGKVAALREDRDRLFNEAKERLRLWLSGPAQVPDWLRERTRYLTQWKNPAGLAALVRDWRQQRFPGDEEILRWLVGWREHELGKDRYEGWWLQERHLHDWEDGQRQKLKRWRKDFYRVWVARLRERYARVIIEDIDWSRLAERAKHEDSKEENKTARRNQKIAAVGRLHEFLREGMADCIAVPAAYSSQRCSACGQLYGNGKTEAPILTCRQCGFSEDRDRRACKELEARGLAIIRSRAA